MRDGEDTDDPPNGPPDGSADDPPESGGEWRFTLKDIETREAEATAEAESRARRSEPIEPGDPSLEGIAFVLLGVVFTLLVISRPLFG